MQQAQVVKIYINDNLQEKKHNQLKLEDYFNFIAYDDIRVQGTRIGIETILYDFIHRGQSPKKIAQTYPSLTLEQVYATVLYYLHNKEAVNLYLNDWLEWSDEVRQEQYSSPSPVIQKLIKFKKERAAANTINEP